MADHLEPYIPFSHQQNHRMPRVLYVASKKLRNFPHDGTINFIADNMGCSCSKYCTQKIVWVAADELKESVGQVLTNLLTKAANNNQAYDLVVTDTSEMAAQVKTIVSSITTEHKPALLIYDPDEMARYPEHTSFSMFDFEVPLSFITAGVSQEQQLELINSYKSLYAEKTGDEQQKFLKFIKETRPEIYTEITGEYCEPAMSGLGKKIESALGEEGVKRLECSAEESTKNTWKDGCSSARQLNEDGIIIPHTVDINSQAR